MIIITCKSLFRDNINGTIIRFVSRSVFFNKLTDRHTGTQKERKTDRHTDGQPEIYIDTNRQSDRAISQSLLPSYGKTALQVPD